MWVDPGLAGTTTLVPHPSTTALLLSLMLLLTACGEAADNILPPPRDGRSGVQLSGLLDDRQVAISAGLPVLNASDCDVQEGPDQDVCVLARDINGELVRIIFENPDVLVDGATLPVGTGDCADPRACDDVTDVAIIDIQFGDRPRQRAIGGTLNIEVAVPATRYRGDFDIELTDGDLSATFDVVPRPDELS